MGVFLKLDGIFLSHAIGFGDNAVTIIMIIMLFVVGLYTIFGGMISVVVTDYIQFTILSLSMLIATIFAFRAVSIDQIARAVHHNLGANGYLGANGFKPFTNSNFGWTFIFWMLLSNFAAAALW
jgi:SSS family solute:Na+ symporter